MKFIEHNAYYRRPAHSFDDTFGLSAKSVIDTMDASGGDIPNQQPTYPIPLHVTISRSQVPVIISNPLNDSLQSHVACEVRAVTEVPGFKRGVHVSRISDCIAQLSGKVFANLQEYAGTLAELIREKAYNGSTRTHVDGVYSYLEKVPGRELGKDKVSLESVGLTASVQTGDQHSQNAGLVVTHMTACPCVQETLKHVGPVPEAPASLPCITHSQRCKTAVSIRNITDALPVRQLLETLDNSIVRTRSTLPREYEALLVYGAHRRPQFVEDVVREVLIACYQLFHQKFPESSLQVSCISQESIHDFDLRAEMERKMQEVKMVLDAQEASCMTWK